MAELNPSEIAIVFSTYYPKWYSGKVKSIKHTDKIRGDLALQSISSAEKKGYQVVVVDGRSTKTFFRTISGMKNVMVVRRLRQTLGGAKRQAIKKAASLPEVKIIVLIEPEKVLVITDFIDVLLKPIRENRADIVVAKRDAKLFKESYPSYMYDSEVEANAFYNETLRANGLLSVNSEDFDMFFGPRVFRNTPSIVKLFMQKYEIRSHNMSFPKDYFDAEQYSNTLFFPIVLALKNKLRVESVTIAFVYPHLQRKNEEKGLRELFLEKRKSQRLGILVELLHFISFLEKNKYSRVSLTKNI